MAEAQHLHFLRFGTFAEQRFFAGDYRDTHNAVLLTGNIVAYRQTAIAAFLAERAIKPFLVDPLTGTFQFPPEQVAAAASARALADRLGPPFSQVWPTRPLTPSDFPEELLRRACEIVADFQTETIRAAAEDAEFAEYYEFVGRTLPRALAVVPMYWVLEARSWQQWLPLNAAAVQLTAAYVHQRGGTPVWAMLAFDRELLDEPRAVDEIIAAYRNLAQADGYVLWVGGLDEHEASKDMLRTLVYGVCKPLSETGRPVVQLYGSYFSFCLIALGYLQGCAHGIEYGEAREFLPVGGGVPASKFYLPAVHRRVPVHIAAFALRGLRYLDSWTAYRANVCSCPVCTDLLSDSVDNFAVFAEAQPKTFMRGDRLVTRAFATGRARLLTAGHYLYCKAAEFERVLNQTPDALVEQLCCANDVYSRNEALPLPLRRHLNVWASVLDEARQQSACPSERR